MDQPGDGTTMPPLTDAQKTRILDAFSAMDPYAYVAPGHQGTTVYYEGYVTLEGLLHVAAVITQIHAEGD